MRRPGPLAAATAVLLVSLSSLPARAAAAAPPAAPPPLPSAESVAPFAPAGKARLFSGESLYEHIDGGAELYLELGFSALSVRRYRHGTDELTAEVYRMSDPTAALAAYLARAGRETPDGTLAIRNSAGKYELLAMKGPLLVVLGNLSGKGTHSPLLRRAAADLLAPIPAAEVPAALLLPAKGREPGSLRLIRGPVGLQPFVTLGEGDILRLGSGVTGAGALYADGSTRLAFAYPDAAAASAVLESVKSHLDAALTSAEATADHLLFTEPSGRKGTLRVEGPRLLIDLVPPVAK